MTRFGHKLNYVINTFVKRTPGSHKTFSSSGIVGAQDHWASEGLRTGSLGSAFCMLIRYSVQYRIMMSRTVFAYNHDVIYTWALGSNIFELKANQLLCNHELYICFENVNDNWLENY